MSMKRRKMPLPMMRRCCGCFAMETGFYIVILISTIACLANITVGAWNLPRHKSREPEDNVISMSMVMFSALSTISNIVAGAGAYLRRPGYLQLSLVFNSVFVVCLFLVAVVTCLFSPELRKTHFLDSPGNIALIVILMLAGVAYTLYYFAMVNTMYRTIKEDDDSAIPI